MANTELLRRNSVSATARPHEGRKAGSKPRGPFNNKRDVLTTRITKETRNALEDASRVTGRSLSQEIEVRLNQSFFEDRAAELFRDRFYGQELAALLELLGRVMQEAGRAGAIKAGAGLTDWLDSPAGYAHATRAALEILNKLAPAQPFEASRSVNQKGCSTAADAILENLAKSGVDSEDRWTTALQSRLGKLVDRL
jgi:hypothetical protein